MGARLRCRVGILGYIALEVIKPLNVIIKMDSTHKFDDEICWFYAYIVSVRERG